jgi:hypothetical protein
MILILFQTELVQLVKDVNAQWVTRSCRLQVYLLKIQLDSVVRPLKKPSYLLFSA